MVLSTEPMAAPPEHNSASESGPVTATDVAYATAWVVHGVACSRVLRPPLAVTITEVPSRIAATRACVAIWSPAKPLTCSWVTGCHAPPPTGRRIRVAVPHPLWEEQGAITARTWPSMTSSDRIDPAGDAALAHCSPPSVVSHRPVPNTKPCDGVANLMPHTAGGGPFSGWPSGTTGAGSPRQLAPRFSVRTIDVHGLCEHGAVPSTNASSGETNVTEVAAIPAGTGPPAGVAAPPVPCPVAVAGLVGAAGADVVAAAAVVPLPLPAPPECCVPQPATASAVAVTSVPRRTAALDGRGRKVILMWSPQRRQPPGLDSPVTGFR